MRIAFGLPGMVDGVAGRRIRDLRPGWDLVDAGSGDWSAVLADADVAVPLIRPVGEEELAGSSIRLVQQFGVGLDTVDLDACRRREVPVANVPSTVSANADAVAEVAVWLTLDLLRGLSAGRDAAASGDGSAPVGRSLAGRRVVLVGLGGLGTATATRLAPFGPDLVAVRAHPEHGGAPGVRSVHGPDELDALLGEADVVVLTATPSGDGPLLDERRLRVLRRGALVVNVARGALIDEDALLAALDDGRVGGAGLDVLRHEPARADDPLVRHPRTVVLPHQGGQSQENLVTTAEALVANVDRLERDEPLRWRRA